MSDLITKTCPECAIEHAVTRALDEQRRLDGTAIYCPNGHRRVYSETTAQRLQRQLTAEQSNALYWREACRRWERSANAYKGLVSRLKRQLGKGRAK